MTSINTLLDILTYKRPHGSNSERAMIARYIDTIQGVLTDAFGNRIIAIGDTATVFSCHTDTVHEQNGRQKIAVDGNVVRLREATPSHKGKDARGTVANATVKDAPQVRLRTCLGADDGAGLYIMLRMIEAHKPGLYIFHRAEEVGGLGSEYLAERELLTQLSIKRAIAFDRRGYSDIITHQMMQRCCSDAFASELAYALGMGHKPCAFGTFTDTANYMYDVPECTNVSVGYHYEHTSREWLNLEYLENLLQAVLATDFEALPTEREPEDNFDLCYHKECIGLHGCLYDFERGYAASLEGV